MALIEMNFCSRILNMNTQMTVVMPERLNGVGVRPGFYREDGKFPVLYLLHGGGGDHTDWLRYSSVERYASELGLALVCPAVAHSAYCNMAYGPRYADFLHEEVWELTHEMFRLSDRREDTFVAGLSMGGHGAFKWGLSQPEKFAAIGALSAGNKIAEKPLTTEQVSQFGVDFRAKRRELVYGKQDLSGLLGNPEQDFFEMARICLGEKKPLPRIFHAIGRQDHNYEGVQLTRQFFEDMPGNPFGYKYHEGEGIHSWEFWEEWIQRFLNWLVEEGLLKQKEK